MVITFYNESWFWTGVLTIFAALCTALGYLVRDIIAGRTQAKLERLRLHESDVFDAYTALYGFVSRAENLLFPPSDPRRDFIDLMRNHYFKSVKPNMLFFSPNIRAILEQFESQYQCFGDPDVIPDPPFAVFIREKAIEELQKLEKAITQRTDRMLHYH